MNWACLGEASTDLTAMGLQAREIALLRAMRDCISWAAEWSGRSEDEIFLTGSATAACDALLRLPRANPPRVLLTTNQAFASITDAAARASRTLGRADEDAVRHEVIPLDQL